MAQKKEGGRKAHNSTDATQLKILREKATTFWKSLEKAEPMRRGAWLI